MKRSLAKFVGRVLFGAYLTASGIVVAWAMAITVAAYYYLITT